MTQIQHSIIIFLGKQTIYNIQIRKVLQNKQTTLNVTGYPQTSAVQ